MVSNIREKSEIPEAKRKMNRRIILLYLDKKKKEENFIPRSIFISNLNRKDRWMIGNRNE